MKTYNEILVERLRHLHGVRYCAPLEAANVIEEQDKRIKEQGDAIINLSLDFHETLQIARDYRDLQKVTISRLEKMEKALRYINDNPWAHPENVKSVVRDALGIK